MLRTRKLVLFASAAVVAAFFAVPAPVSAARALHTVSSRSVSWPKANVVAAKKKCTTKKVHGKKKKVCKTVKAPAIDWSGTVASWAYFPDTKTFDVRIGGLGNPNPVGYVDSRSRSSASAIKPPQVDDIAVSGSGLEGAALDAPVGSVKTKSSGIDLVEPFSLPLDVGIHVSVTAPPAADLALQFQMTTKTQGFTIHSPAGTIAASPWVAFDFFLNNQSVISLGPSCITLGTCSQVAPAIEAHQTSTCSGVQPCCDQSDQPCSNCGTGEMCQDCQTGSGPCSSCPTGSGPCLQCGDGTDVCSPCGGSGESPCHPCEEAGKACARFGVFTDGSETAAAGTNCKANGALNSSQHLDVIDCQTSGFTTARFVLNGNDLPQGPTSSVFSYDANGKLISVMPAERTNSFLTNRVFVPFNGILSGVPQSNDCDGTGVKEKQAGYVQTFGPPFWKDKTFFFLSYQGSYNAVATPNGMVSGQGRDPNGNPTTLSGSLTPTGPGSAPFSLTDAVPQLNCTFKYNAALSLLTTGSLVSQTGLLFKAQPGATTQQTLIFTNLGVAPLTINGFVSPSTSAFALKVIGSENYRRRIVKDRAALGSCSTSLVLQAGDSCEVAVSFAPPPGAGALLTDTFGIKSTDPNEPERDIVLVGFVQQPPACSSFTGLSASFTAYNGQLPLSFSVSGKTSGDPASSTWTITFSGYGGGGPFTETANFSSQNPYFVVPFKYQDENEVQVGELDVYLKYDGAAKTMTLLATASGNVGGLSINPSTVPVTSTPGACS